MREATYDEVVALLKTRPGVPGYWAGVFVKARLSLRAIEVYLETSELDFNSPLRLGKSEFLGKELEDLQGAYGLAKDDSAIRYDETLRYLASTTEQDAVVREVAHYATVRFKPAKTASYCAHVVARSIRMINGRYLMKLVPAGSRVLEAGADLRTLPYRPVDFTKYRAAIPTIGVRDVVRHSYQAVCRRILESRKHDDRVLERARLMLEKPDEVFERVKVQDATFRADVIITNDASHDIPFSDMPTVMSARGATMWVGAMMRVKGLSRFSTFKTGEVPVLGARFNIDYDRDTIAFHFKHDASFDYTHKLSEHRRYEEHMDYVFRGGEYDYVYTKLPATTASTLFFCVYRVPAAPYSISEPSFAPTGYAGKVRIKSVKAIGDDASGLPRGYEPFEFDMDEEIYCKVAERRQSLGVAGNFGMTMSYLRSVRVRFYINGEPVGAEGKMGQELMESAGVAIEVVVAENRRMIDATLQAIDVSHSKALASVLTQACDVRHLSGRIKDYFGSVWTDVRAKLVKAALAPEHKLVVEVVRQPAYVRIDDVSTDVKCDVVRDASTECVCDELKDAHAALQFGSLTFAQERDLRAYVRHLSMKPCSVCVTADQVVTAAADADDDMQEFFDAESTVVDSCDTAESSAMSLATISSISEQDNEFDTYVSEAMDEYVSLQRFISKAVKSKVKRDAAILFNGRPPSEADLVRFSTGRVKHYIVEVRNGELVKVLGGGKITDLSACYSTADMQLKWVQRKSGKYYLQDGITGWLYSSSSLEVFNNDELASAVETVKSDPVGACDPRRCTFVQGVPGAGKTYEIVTQMRECKDNMSVLYLSSTVKSAEEVRSKVYGTGLDGIKRVRTLDSFMIGAPVKADRVWVDEAPMAHAGQIFSALFKCMCSHAQFYGDFQQIPYCSFTSTTEFNVLFSSLSGMMKQCDRPVTHRCPPDVCRMWRDRYAGGFSSCDCVEHKRPERSVSVQRISTASQIPYCKDTRYMVFTQAEKVELHQSLGFDAAVDVLRKRTSSGLATVHEDQGTTHAKVAVVRLIARFDPKESAEAPSIYNRIEYALTATTRHTDSFVYYTKSVEQDVLVKRIHSVLE